MKTLGVLKRILDLKVRKWREAEEDSIMKRPT
jgi:hypothetical protein